MIKARALAMSAGVALSRVTGLLREQSFAYLFGAGAATDAFVAAFRIPNFFRDLLAENVASAAIVPSYVGARERDPAAAKLFLRRVLALILIVASTITLAGIAFAGWIVPAIAGGFDAERTNLTVLLSRWLMPFLILISIAAYFQAVANAEGKYFLPAFSTALLNIVFIGTGWFLVTRVSPPILGMAIGALLGAGAAIVLLVPIFRGAAGTILPARPLFDGDMRSMLKLAVPVVLGVAATDVNVLVNTLAASYAEEGSIAYLNFAYRIMHLPLGLISVSLGAAALPLLSSAFARGDVREYRAMLLQALRYSARLTVPATVGLILLARPIIDLLYGYGAFTASDVRQTSFALIAYAIGIPAFSFNRILAPAFYARKEPGVAVRIGVVSVGMNILFNFAALLTGAGFIGIALSASAAGYIQSALLFVRIRKVTLRQSPR